MAGEDRESHNEPGMSCVPWCGKSITLTLFQEFQNEGRCYAIANCLTRKLSVQHPTAHSFLAPSSSKVTPQPAVSGGNEIPGTPRLVRSRAVRRDLVQNWNFDEVVMA